MTGIVRSGEIQPSPGGTVKFEGGPYGSEISFYWVNNEPGAGPVLHRHPYSETWIVRIGRASFTVDGKEIDAGPGDILVVSAGTPHKFKNTGEERLELICIHASPRMIQEDLED